MVNTLGNLTDTLAHTANVHDTRPAGTVSKTVVDMPPRIFAFSRDTGCWSTDVEYVKTTVQRKLYISGYIHETFAVLSKRCLLKEPLPGVQIIEDCRKLSKHSFDRLRI